MGKAGLCTIAFKNNTIYESIDIAESAGAEGVEIWGQPPHVDYPINKEKLKKIKNYTKEKKMEICAFGSYLRPGNNTVFNDVEITIENQIEIAKLLGTHIVRIWAGVKDHDDYTEDEIIKIINQIKEWGETAKKDKIHIVLERHCGTILNKWDNAGSIIKKLTSHNVFLNYQIPYPAAVEEYKSKSINDYTELLKYSKHAHLHNFSFNKTLSKTFLSDGIIDYSKLTDAVKNTGYNGYFMVEFPAFIETELNEIDVIKKDIDFILQF